MTEQAILHLYGFWPGEPTQPTTDKIFERRDIHQEMLKSSDDGPALDYHVGYVNGEPTQGDTLPRDITIARNPVFDDAGKLVSGDFQPVDSETIRNYPVVLDHYVAGFRQKRFNAKGIEEEVAEGIGIEARRAINFWRVQNYGNDKRAAERDILIPSGVALMSYNGTFEGVDLLSGYWGEGEFIFKPDSGAGSKGVIKFNSLKELHQAIRSGSIRDNGQIQPYLDLTDPLPHLKALDPIFDSQLAEINGKPDRPREVRMHYFATTFNGASNVEVYPTLRTSKPGTEFMTDWLYTALDPELFEHHYPDVVESTKRSALRLLTQANVPHAYGAADVAISGTSKHEKHADERFTFTVDFNARGPRLPDVSIPGHDIITPAQRAFIRMQKRIATDVLRAS